MNLKGLERNNENQPIISDVQKHLQSMNEKILKLVEMTETCLSRMDQKIGVVNQEVQDIKNVLKNMQNEGSMNEGLLYKARELAEEETIRFTDQMSIETRGRRYHFIHTSSILSGVLELLLIPAEAGIGATIASGVSYILKSINEHNATLSELGHMQDSSIYIKMDIYDDNITVSSSTEVKCEFVFQHGGSHEQTAEGKMKWTNISKYKNICMTSANKDISVRYGHDLFQRLQQI